MITPDDFRIAMGQEPTNEDMERCNCDQQGTPGHYYCGWCPDCDLPRYYCGHDHPRTRAEKED